MSQPWQLACQLPARTTHQYVAFSSTASSSSSMAADAAACAASSAALARCFARLCDTRMHRNLAVQHRPPPCSWRCCRHRFLRASMRNLRYKVARGLFFFAVLGGDSKCFAVSRSTKNWPRSSASLILLCPNLCSMPPGVTAWRGRPNASAGKTRR